MLPLSFSINASSISAHHQPVMVEQVLSILHQLDPTGKTLRGSFVDGTVGGGGHAESLLECLDPEGRLICFDRDPNALASARQRLKRDPRVNFVQASYSNIEKYLPAESVSGILLDLGLSTDQLESNRGFSYDQDSPLDMRFDPSTKTTAFDVVNNYSIAKLRDVFFKYGEEPLSPRIARRVAEARKFGAIRSTFELVGILREVVPPRVAIKAFARVFQAIRIEVNDEIELLERGLEACWRTLRPGGVLCGIAYHSLEDRRIKRFIAQKVKGCICPPKLPVCVCGRKPSARPATSSLLRPSAKEIRTNPRSRSARLRAAVKIQTR